MLLKSCSHSATVASYSAISIQALSLTHASFVHLSLNQSKEGMDRTYEGGIKAYWKRRGYYRIDAAAAQRRPPLPTAKLGGGGVAQAPEDGSGRRHRRRRGWHVRRGKLGRRLLSALSPRRWLMRLRDAYVSAMLRLASSPAVVGYGAGGPYCATASHGHGTAVQLKEYDEKVLVEIYRSILARGGPLPIAVTTAGDGAGAPAAAATLRLPTAV
ncbi:uncharacterized protein [Miscanthus floridulus]|uniref:uncharacterized protein n=1 Tax=Miscanthus floridulus TaxID=154761 RepID=UPI00345974BB